MSVNNRLYLHVIMLLLLNSVKNDTFQSLLTRHESGTDFVPPHPVELLATLTSVSTFDACFNYCHQNIRCRTLVSILMSPFSCRLYEGVSDTGTITSSMAPGSRVGSIHYYPELYGKYGQPCNPALPLPDRYMVCQNGVWSCPINTYWDGSLCRNAVYYNGSCKANNQCRQDLGLQCDLLRERCGCNLTVAWNGTSCDGATNMIYMSGTGYTQRYSDCCKASCAWPGKAAVTSPVLSCAQNGITHVDNNTQSICNSGSAYACTAQRPWNVSGTLSYGFASVGLSGYNESSWCCTCFSLLFTDVQLIGKGMIVQVISSNGQSGNCFGLQIPGSGWGSSPNACATQFNVSSGWGVSNGGISSRSACALLPAVLQSGCYWRFDWLLDIQNPNVTFQDVPCPSALTSITGCQRL